jgi:hypothetical protein
MVKYVCYIGLWIQWFRDPGAVIPNSSIIIGQTSLVGVDHSRSNSITPLTLCMLCCAKAGTLTLYYKSLGTATILLRIGNISDRPCMRVMTYNELVFSCIKTIR